VADSDPRISVFLASLTRAGLTEARIAELHDHLLCSIQKKVGAAMPAGTAVAAAIAELGDIAPLTIEYRKEDLMHPLQKLFGLVFVLCVLVTAVRLEGGHIEMLVSGIAVVPLLMVGGVTLGGLIASFGMRRVAQLFAVAVCGRSAPTHEAELLQQVCQRGRRLAWTGCVLMLTFSAMHICSVLDRPEMIGPGIGWALLAVIYAALLADLGFGSAERWVAHQTA
jgi:hypothetical protein